jgi:AraC family transcriptional regulator
MNDSFDRFESAPAMLVAGLRRQHAMSEAPASIPRQWSDFMQLDLPAVNAQRAVGAYCSMSADGFEYLTGVEVEGFDDLPDDVGRMRIPAQDYAVFVHDGHVSEIGRTWQGIWKDWLPGSGYEDADTPPFELYDERFDPATGEGGFEIWFPVRARK